MDFVPEKSGLEGFEGPKPNTGLLALAAPSDIQNPDAMPRHEALQVLDRSVARSGNLFAGFFELVGQVDGAL